MDNWFHPARAIDTALRRIAGETDGFDSDFDPGVRTAEPRFGDFQANGVLPHAKAHRCNPRELGSRLIEAAKTSGEFDPDKVELELAGPGFINFRLSNSFLHDWMVRYRTSEDFQQASGKLHTGRKVVVDFSSPNTAKQMHVGHIRSTVIGESISRLLCFCGAEVIRDNHIGDWGTQFGILILAIKRERYDASSKHSDPLEDFERLYKKGSALTKDDASALDAARTELLKLQQGDPENTALWELICKVSYTAFDEIYERLGVHFDEVLGESFYRDKADLVYSELTAKGIASEDEGALVVFHPEHPRFATQPFIIRKSDGASNYGTTDLATVLHRTDELGANEIVYVTDGRQQDHFQQLFLTVEKWFAATGREAPALRHVWFGTILGEDNKAIKTRSGEPIRLKQLLDEAEERAFRLVTEKNPDLPEDERRSIARAVGLGAVRYADLSQNRSSDYVFSWEKLLSFEGNTAPYLLYAVARIHSIFRKAGLNPSDLLAREGTGTGASVIHTDTEIALARKLVGSVSALDQTLADLRPHFLCTYLYELAGAFSSFYNAEKVMVDDPAVRARRLMLCHRTLMVLETGLGLLGIETLERM